MSNSNGGASNYQSLKSANLVRVDVGKSEHLYAARQNLGESLMCPAGAQYLMHDIYGRPASQNTLSVNLDASCGQGSQYNAQRHIQIENMERPYLPICAAGLRGAADFMGVGRDLIPQNLYGEGERGNMVRHYNTKNNAPWDWQVSKESMQPYYYWRVEQPFTFSHDASKSAYYHG
jgi:hypothetical protein